MLSIIGILHAAGGGVTSFQLAPLTNIILVGVRGTDAGSASGVLTTVMQAGGAFGVAVMGVIFFNLIGTGADRAALWWLRRFARLWSRLSRAPPCRGSMHR